MRVLKYRKTDKQRLGATRHANKAERVKLHVRTGDTVQVMRGKAEDKGKQGKVLRVFPKTGRVLIEGVNIVKKHRRARRPEEQSGILEMPAPIAASKVMLLDPTTGAPTRARKQIAEDGTKTRVSVKSGAEIAAPAPTKG
jgi:large subunit ribosomal protein L24